MGVKVNMIGIIEDILKEAFYDSLCEVNTFGCIVGFIAYKLPTLIIVIFILILLVRVIQKYA